MWSWTNVIFEKMSQKCEQFSYEIFWGICLGFLVLNSPLTSLKHPSEGYQYGTLLDSYGRVGGLNWTMPSGSHRRPLNCACLAFRGRWLRCGVLHALILFLHHLEDLGSLLADVGRSLHIFGMDIIGGWGPCCAMFGFKGLRLKYGKASKMVPEAKGSRLEPKGYQKWAKGRPQCMIKPLRFQEHVLGGASLRKGCHSGATWPMFGSHFGAH